MTWSASASSSRTEEGAATGMATTTWGGSGSAGGPNGDFHNGAGGDPVIDQNHRFRIFVKLN